MSLPDALLPGLLTAVTKARDQSQGQAKVFFTDLVLAVEELRVRRLDPGVLVLTEEERELLIHLLEDSSMTSGAVTGKGLLTRLRAP
jgi:hypothetical protein